MPGPNIRTDASNPASPPQNPLDEDKVSEKEALSIYSEEDKKYLDFLQERLERAKRQMDQSYEELNGKTIYQYHEQNEKKANTWLTPKQNDDDVVVSDGTVQQKLDAVLSNINNLNLSAEIFPFSKDNERLNELGVGMEDIVHDTEIQDGADGAGRRKENFKTTNTFKARNSFCSRRVATQI